MNNKVLKGNMQKEPFSGKRIKVVSFRWCRTRASILFTKWNDFEKWTYKLLDKISFDVMIAGLLVWFNSLFTFLFFSVFWTNLAFLLCNLFLAERCECLSLLPILLNFLCFENVFTIGRYFGLIWLIIFF